MYCYTTLKLSCFTLRERKAFYSSISKRPKEKQNEKLKSRIKIKKGRQLIRIFYPPFLCDRDGLTCKYKR